MGRDLLQRGGVPDELGLAEGRTRERHAERRRLRLEAGRQGRQIRRGEDPGHGDGPVSGPRRRVEWEALALGQKSLSWRSVWRSRLNPKRSTVEHAGIVPGGVALRPATSAVVTQVP